MANTGESGYSAQPGSDGPLPVHHIDALREQVTSKGGTTAAALDRFGERGMAEAIQEGIAKAYARAKQLAL